MRLPLLLPLVCLSLVRPCLPEEQQLLYRQDLKDYPFHITLPTMVEGHTFPFVLDTGSTVNICDVSLRGTLGARTTTVNTRMHGGYFEIDYYGSPSMAIGSFLLPAKPVGVLDVAAMRVGSGIEVRGLIGAVSFVDHVLSFDFDNHSLSVLKSLSKVPSGMTTLDLEYGRDNVCPCISVTLSGEKVILNIDTGSLGAIDLDSATFSRLSASGIIVPDDSATTIVTAMGKTKLSGGNFVSGKLMDVNLKDFPVSNARTGNYLGLEFLVNFDFIIDWKERKFHFRRRRILPPLHINRMLGAAIVFLDGNGVVIDLKPGGGPAGDVGIKKRDTIVRFGDIERGKFNMPALYEACQKHAGQTVTVEVVREGELKSIIMELKVGEKQFVRPLNVDEK